MSLRLVLSASITVLCADLALAAPNQWINENGGDASTPANWSDGIPTVDDALSVVAGSYEVNLDTPITTASLIFDQENVVIGGPGTLTLNSGITWSGGTLRGSSLTEVIAVAGNSTISQSVELDNRTLNQSGTLSFADGAQLFLTADSSNKGAVFSNLGGATFTALGSGTIVGSANTEFQTRPEFRNAGIFAKIGPGLIEVGGEAIFVHTGTLNLSAGSLRVGDFRPSGASSVVVGAGSSLLLDRINSSDLPSFSGAGEVTIGSGTVTGSYAISGLTTIGGGSFGALTNFDNAGPVSFGNLAIINGDLGGTAPLTATGTLAWRGGIVGTNVAQTFTLASAATATIPIETSVTLSRRTFQNQGTVTWNGSAVSNGSQFRLRAGAIFDNLPGATFTAAGFGTSTTSISNIDGQFNNGGTFVKSGAATVTEIGWGFANTGLVNVQGGTLSLEKVTGAAGVWQVAGGSTLVIQRPARADVYDGAYSVAAGGLLVFRRGTITTAASFPVGTGTIELRTEADIARDSLPVALLRINGEMKVAPPSGTFALGNSELVNGVLDSTGTVNLTGNLHWTSGTIGVLSAFDFRVTPTGTVHVDGVSQSLFTAKLVNDGTIFVDSGELRARAGFANHGTIHLAGASKLSIETPIAKADVGNILGTTTSAVKFTNTLTNTGETIALNATTGNWRLENTGRIVGGNLVGTVDAAGNGAGLVIAPSSGSLLAVLDGTQVQNGILLNENLARVRLLNGANIQGVVAVKGSNAVVQIETDVNLDNVEFAINVDNTAPQPGSLVVLGTRTVTLGPNSYFHGANGSINGDFFVSGNPSPTGTATIINQGRISGDISGSTFRVNLVDVFENQGTLEAINGASLSVQREFTQSAGFIRLDEGTLTMSVAPSFATTRTVTLAGGRLEGNGVLNGNLLVQNATIAPGLGSANSAVGLLTINEQGTHAFSLSSGSNLEFHLGGTAAGVTFDQLDVNGTAAIMLAGNLQIRFTGGFEFGISPADAFSVLIADGPLGGGFANVINGRVDTLDGLGSFAVSTAGSAVTLSDFQGIPEPTAAAMLLSGLLALGARRGRRSASQR
jgi:hypothetical protein